MRERILAPLGMDDTGFCTPPGKVARRANLYFSDQNGPLLPVRHPLFTDYDSEPTMASGGGGLVSTAADYARYAQMLLNGGELNGRRILSAAAVKQRMTDHLLRRC